MTIKEIEKVLGIPRATVRFYEKEGLLAPCRTENGYRDYSDEDVKKLKKIIFVDNKFGKKLGDFRVFFVYSCVI